MEILEANLDAMYMDDEDERLGRVPFLAQMGGPPGALAAMPEAFKEVVPEVASGSLKGLISGIGGTPGEVAGLLSGLMNTISPRNYKGEPHEEGMSIGDRFIQGYEAVPFKTEDIRDALTEAGWDVEGMGEPFEFITEFIGPSKAVTGAAKAGVSKVKALVDDVTVGKVQIKETKGQ